MVSTEERHLTHGIPVLLAATFSLRDALTVIIRTRPRSSGINYSPSCCLEAGTLPVVTETAPLIAQSGNLKQETERVCAVVDLSESFFVSSASQALTPPPPPGVSQERGFNYGRDLA